MDALVIGRFNNYGKLFLPGMIVTSPADMTDEDITTLVQRGRLLPLEPLMKHLESKKAVASAK